MNGAALMDTEVNQVGSMMRYISLPLKDKKIAVPGMLSKVHIAAQRTDLTLRALLAKRQDRLWLSLVAVPLAMIVVALQLDLRLLIPIAVACWWWASSESQWLWLLGLIEGCFGIHVVISRSNPSCRVSTQSDRGRNRMGCVRARRCHRWRREPLAVQSPLWVVAMPCKANVTCRHFPVVVPCALSPCGFVLGYVLAPLFGFMAARVAMNERTSPSPLHPPRTLP